MSAPYRTPEPVAEERAMTFAITGKGALGLAPRLFVQSWLLLIPVTILASVSLQAAAASLVGLVGWAVFDTRRRARRDRVSLRVDATNLELRIGDAAPVQLALSALLDVRLDSKAVHKSLGHARADGLNSVFGPAIAGGPTVESDECRLELVLEGKAPVTLGDERATRGHSLDSLRAVRLFLRRNGWVPEDERPEPQEPPMKQKKKRAHQSK